MLQGEDYDNRAGIKAENMEGETDGKKAGHEEDEERTERENNKEDVRNMEQRIHGENIPEINLEMTLPPAQDEGFASFLTRDVQRLEQLSAEIPGSSYLKIDEIYGVIYVPVEEALPLEVDSYTYNAIPKCYTYMDLEAMNAAGITRLQNHPYLKLRGEGTMIAVIDSGIDYQNPLFRTALGTRIIGIWDQTLTGEQVQPENQMSLREDNHSENQIILDGGLLENQKQSGSQSLLGDFVRDSRKVTVPFGRFFSREDINRALASENPLDIVPSTDTNGHGTMLAALAAGNLDAGENFSGAAPEASLLIVKVKPAKNYLRQFYLFPPEAEVLAEDDLMLALDWCTDFAAKDGTSLSVCLGVGSSQGAHVGRNPLSVYAQYVTGYPRVSVSVAAGNEGAARHHFLGRLGKGENPAAAELRVADGEEGFTMEFWGEAPEQYNLSVQTPTGETLDISSSIGSRTQELSFVFVETKVLVNYIPIERQTGSSLVYFRFLNPVPGIWRIHVRGRREQEVSFHLWLPVSGLISEDTYFLESTPYNTVTAPGDTSECITATAYQYRDNSLYLSAGRGFMPDGAVTPDLAVPGVNLTVPLRGGLYGSASGTSLSTAICAGAAALLFQWAVVRGNQPLFSGNSVKYYLQRGAYRDEGRQYPNQEWGYGRLDLYHTFELLT